MSNAATLFLSAFVSVIISVTSYPADGKIFLYLMNVAEVFYLTAFNGWSTNKLIGLVAKYQNRNFNPHGKR
jgi:hypothetical protein